MAAMFKKLIPLAKTGLLPFREPDFATNYAGLYRQNSGLGWSLITLLACVGGALVLGMGIARSGVGLAGALVGGPPALVFAGLCLNRPKVGVYACLIIGFFLFSHSLGDIVGRILPIQTGLLLDGCLLLSLLGVLSKANKDDWSRLHNPATYLVLFWLLYNVFELINPESISREPWLVAVRGFSLYWFEITIIGLICLTKRADLELFIRLWLISCLIHALWSFKQQYLGLTDLEADWLENIGRSTHLLNGQLRSFSLCPDAGQFGAVMAHASLYAFIRMLDEPTLRRKMLYAVLGAVYFWGYAVAGSRGPIVVLGAGFAIYLLLRRNIVLLVTGSIVLGLAFGMLKYTHIGQSNYQIQRMRSSMDPNDPSLQLRLYNQRLSTLR